MGLITTEAIILKTTKYSDNSIICNALSEDKGYISFIASRSGKSNQSLINHLQIMNILQITYYESKSGKIHRIKEVCFSKQYKTINIDILRSICGTLLVEVVINLVKDDTLPNVTYYPYLLEKLLKIDQDLAFKPNGVIIPLMELLEIEGFLPINNFSETNTFFNMDEAHFQDQDKLGLNILNLERSQLFSNALNHHPPTNSKELITVLEDVIKYFTLHIPQFKPLKTLPIFKEMVLT